MRRLPPVCCSRSQAYPISGRTRSAPRPSAASADSSVSSRSNRCAQSGCGGQPVQQGAGAPAEQRGQVHGVPGQLAGRHPEQRAGPAPAQPQLQPGLPVALGDLGRVQVQPADQRHEGARRLAAVGVGQHLDRAVQAEQEGQVRRRHPLVHARRRRLQVVAGVGADVAAQSGHRAAPTLLRLARDRHPCRCPAHTVYTPVAPSTDSRIRSAWPLCRAYSSIMCTRIQRRLNAAAPCRSLAHRQPVEPAVGEHPVEDRVRRADRLVEQPAQLLRAVRRRGRHLPVAVGVPVGRRPRLDVLPPHQHHPEPVVLDVRHVLDQRRQRQRARLESLVEAGVVETVGLLAQRGAVPVEPAAQHRRLVGDQRWRGSGGRHEQSR